MANFSKAEDLMESDLKMDQDLKKDQELKMNPDQLDPEEAEEYWWR